MADEPKYGGIVGSHSHGEAWDATRAARTHAEALRARQARHQAILAERKAKREAAKASARQQGEFVGPPNPFMYRKGRPPMRVK